MACFAGGEGGDAPETKELLPFAEEEIWSHCIISISYVSTFYYYYPKFVMSHYDIYEIEEFQPLNVDILVGGVNFTENFIKK